MSEVMSRANASTIRRLNGLGGPPSASKFLQVEDINHLRRFADVIARHHVGRMMFANRRPGDILKAKKNRDQPQEGQLINPSQVYGISEPSGKGIVRAIPRHEDLAIRMRKKMRKDPQFALGLAAIKAPVMAAFEAIKVNCRDPKIRAFVHHCLMVEEGGILRRAVYTGLRSLELGFAPHELIWTNNKTVTFLQDPEDGGEDPIEVTLPSASILHELADLDPEYTEVNLNEKDGSYAGVRYGFDDGQIVPGDKTWLVTHDREFGHMLGSSVLDPNYDTYLWASIMYLFCNRYYERKASPPIKGRAPAVVVDADGTQIAGVDLFTKMLDTLISEGIIVLPSDLQGDTKTSPALWDVEYMTDDKRGEMFLAYINHLQTLKLRGLLIPEMVIERGAPAGTFAMARAHTDTFVGMLTLVLENVLYHINRYLVPKIVKYNFGDDAPYCSIDTLTRIGDRTDLLEQLLTTIIGAEAKQGSLDTSRIVDIIGLLRQLNVGVGTRRNLPDFQDKTDTQHKVLLKQVSLQEGAQKNQRSVQDRQLKIQEKAQKIQENVQDRQLKVQERAQRVQEQATKHGMKLNERAAAHAQAQPKTPVVSAGGGGTTIHINTANPQIKNPPMEGQKSTALMPTVKGGKASGKTKLSQIETEMFETWKLNVYESLATGVEEIEVPLIDQYCDEVEIMLQSNGMMDTDELATEIVAQRVAKLQGCWNAIREMDPKERKQFLLDLEIA